VPDSVPVAIACCRHRTGGDATDLYPDVDSELLCNSLAARGVAAEMVSWDNPRVQWEQWALIVIRSTWDSVDRPDEYLRWVHRASRSSELINPSDVIDWNLDKAYLRDLELDGVPVVPTQWLRRGSDRTFPEGEFVIKPAISAGGRQTARYGPGHEAAARSHLERLFDESQTVMLQPYIPSVSDPGEISLIFVDDEFSHAVRKGPVLELGEDAPPQPWERMTILGLTAPTLAERAVAESALRAVRRRFGEGLLFARVDLLQSASGGPLVLEVELIDPNLSLTLSPAATDSLASAIAARAASASNHETSPG
jgi:glutathione synthase/RimK-type ligase-like ATP-grasp enzyme